MAGIAIMGYGVIGSGVAEALRKNADAIERKAGGRVELLRVLDVLDFPDSPVAGIVTHDVGDLMGDGRIGIVVETMGGTGVAYEFTKMALSRGKHVVTSNKDLVAEYGPELLELAHRHGARYLFEAAVGGGMPILRPIERCLAANRITALSGIVNGTTNHMLTYMHEHGSNYKTTLDEAQRLGITEKDPASDVEGLDAARKLAILSSIAFGAFVDWKMIPRRGITSISSLDIRRASELGCAVKLLAHARLAGAAPSKLLASVAPVFVRRGHAFYGVNGAYNAVLATGDLVGDVLFSGIGAGMLPTASAVVADIIDISCSGGRPRAGGAIEGGGDGGGDGGAGGDCSLDATWDRNNALAPEADDSDPALSEPGLFYARLSPASEEPAPTPAARAGLESVLFRTFPDAMLFPEDNDGVPSICFTAKAASEAAFKAGLESVAAAGHARGAAPGARARQARNGSVAIGFQVGTYMRVIES